jgi:hypothetical protein
MCLALAVGSPMTNAGAVSIASIVEAPKILAGADFMVLAADASIAYEGAFLGLLQRILRRSM